MCVANPNCDFRTTPVGGGSPPCDHDVFYSFSTNRGTTWNPAVTVTVTVTNSRKADLVQLEAAKSGSADWKKVVGPVKSGKQASAKLPQGSDCRFDLRGTFDDGESMDAADINVCADKTLNLTD